MTPTALKALKGSIKKWEEIVAGTGEDHGDDNCPLCIKYFKKGCAGCPVAVAVEDTCCNGTPYREDWERLNYPDKAETDEEKAAASKMLSFLQGLLPAKTTKIA